MAHGDRSVDVFVRKLRQKLERGLVELAIASTRISGLATDRSRRSSRAASSRSPKPVRPPRPRVGCREEPMTPAAVEAHGKPASPQAFSDVLQPEYTSLREAPGSTRWSSLQFEGDPQAGDARRRARHLPRLCGAPIQSRQDRVRARHGTYHAHNSCAYRRRDSQRVHDSFTAA